MAIHWYPGHMHKARKEMVKALPKVDLVIEVLDARIPYSSENPVIETIRTKNGYTKPCIKLLNKSDLADDDITKAWCESFDAQGNVKALPIMATQTGQVKPLIAACRQLFPDRNKEKPIHAMIMGIPNVGKSTLINALAGKVIVKTGNEPAITKNQQRIDLGNGIVLWDTPGILWPKIENENSGYRLACIGSIKDTAMDYDDVGFYLFEYLLVAYPELLKARYDIENLPDNPLQFLEHIGARRGCLGAGGLVDLVKISTILINELRNGTLGKISLETPEMVEKEMVEVERILKEKADKKAARKNRFKGKK